MVRPGVDGITNEVAGPLKLISGIGRIRRQARLDPAVGQRLKRVGVKIVEVVVAVFAWGWRAEQAVIEADLGGQRMGGRDPVKRRFHLPPIGRRSAAGRGVVRAVKLHDLAGRVLDDVGAQALERFTIDSHVGLAAIDGETGDPLPLG